MIRFTRLASAVFFSCYFANTSASDSAPTAGVTIIYHFCDNYNLPSDLSTGIIVHNKQ